MNDRLDPRVLQKTAGPTWEPLRGELLAACDCLLSVDARVKSQLTTIYVKFLFDREGEPVVWAVIWIRRASEFVIGLSMAPTVTHPRLHDAPKGMMYPRLTKYVTVRPTEPLPAEFHQWAKTAMGSAQTATAMET